MANNRLRKIQTVIGVFVGFSALLVAVAWWVVSVEGWDPTRRAVGAVVQVLFSSARGARRQLQGEVAKIKGAGEPLTIEQIVPQEVPDPENAAVLYEQAFAELNISDVDKGGIFDLVGSIRQPRRNEAPPVAAIAQIVEKNASAIMLLEAASGRPKCRFPVEWQASMGAIFPHYSKLKECTWLLAAKMMVHAQHGQMTQVVETARVTLALAEAISTEPILIGQLVRHSIIQITFQGLQAALSAQYVQTGACLRLFDDLREVEFIRSFVRSLWGERIAGMQFFDLVRRDRPTAAAIIIDEPWAEPWFRLFYGHPLGPKMLAMDETVYLRVMSYYVHLAGRPWRDYGYPWDVDREIRDQMPMYAMVAHLLLGRYRHTLLKRDRATVHIGLVQAALALKAYNNKMGQYPASLAELRKVIPWELPEDPFSGQDFVYKSEGDGFLVYSVGPNLKDDGGTVAKDWEEGDIIWRCKK